MCTNNLDHLHVGYYDNDYDIETIIYQVNGKSIFYLDEDQEIDYSKLNNYKYIDNYGYKILEIEAEELDYEEALDYFEKWLVENNLLQTK